MRAVIYHEYGSPEVLHLAEVEIPTPKDDEVRIRVHATSVTTGDCNLRGFVFVPNGLRGVTRLVSGIRRPSKPILGVEFAGEVEAIGKDVTVFKVGDAVFGLDGSKLGAYAEYKCIAQDAGIVLKPDNLTFEEAAIIPNGALTAYTFLKKLADMQAGQTALIIGASGSVGSAAVQIAKYLGGQVTGVCSTGNIDLVKSLGADAVVDYTQVDYTQPGPTYDLIFDAVGASSFAACKPVLSPGGAYLAVAGGILEFWQMLRTSLLGNKKVVAGLASEKQADLVIIREMVAGGHLKPIIDRSYPLEEIVAAHRYVDAGHKKGNVVIHVAPAAAS